MVLSYIQGGFQMYIYLSIKTATHTRADFLRRSTHGKLLSGSKWVILFAFLCVQYI